MTDSHDEIDVDAEEEEKKKGEGEGEEGVASRGEANVSHGFFEYMAQIGASKSLIAEVLRTWRHLKGEGLLRRISTFARGLVKSSHIQVEIGPKKGFSVVHRAVKFMKGAQAKNLEAKPETKPQTQPTARPDLSHTPKPH